MTGLLVQPCSYNVNGQNIQKFLFNKICGIALYKFNLLRISNQQFIYYGINSCRY